VRAYYTLISNIGNNLHGCNAESLLDNDFDDLPAGLAENSVGLNTMRPEASEPEAKP
jgi:hypothetical protein